MRKVILDLAVTLDGYIEGPNGEVDWCIMDEEMDFSAFLSSIDTIFTAGSVMIAGGISNQVKMPRKLTGDFGRPFIQRKNTFFLQQIDLIRMRHLLIMISCIRFNGSKRMAILLNERISGYTAAPV